MKKLLATCALSFMILSICSGIMSKSVCVAEVDDVTSKSAIVMDYGSKEVLYEKSSHEKMPVASMVKMMTILLTVEDIEAGDLALSDMVTTSENASGMGGSQVFLDAYVDYSVGDLLKSVIMASANDASVALAEHISGSEEVFVKRMNKRAKELGMFDTNYVNCTGLPAPEGYSSAYDSAIVLSQVSGHDIYHEYSTIWMDELVHPSGRKTGLVNTNRLIRYYNGCDGGKTGSTNEAGCCLSATAKRGDMRLISVVVGAKDSKTRFNECSKLFNYGFANFENVNLISTENPVSTLAVNKGKTNAADIFAAENYSALIKKGSESGYEVELKLPSQLFAPLKQGQVVGTAEIYKYGVLVKSIDLVSNLAVQKIGYFECVKLIGEKW